MDKERLIALSKELDYWLGDFDEVNTTPETEVIYVKVRAQMDELDDLIESL